jgi:two-component system chemotaxis response regulator CheB
MGGTLHKNGGLGMSDNIKVLVVDDSALMRNLISKMIDEVEGLEVAGKAMNGIFALKKIQTLRPHIIVLDLEMPEMNGIEFLKKRKELGIKIPVIILSSLASKGAQITMEALDLGASDFIQKPSGAISKDIHLVKHTLSGMLLGYGGKYKGSGPTQIPDFNIKKAPANLQKHAQTLTKEELGKIHPAKEQVHGPKSLLVIGISTGGPNALRQLLPELRPDLPWPMVVVQHMPEGFTLEFARSLNKICPFEVKEAEDGDLIKVGRILIAPGNQQLSVEKRSLAGLVHLDPDAEHQNGHRPSVGHLFESVLKSYGKEAVAVIMTGMGRDGSVEIGGIYRAGGMTIAQDAETSVVYGMPKVAAQLGNVEKILPLEGIAPFLNKLAEVSL